MAGEQAVIYLDVDDEITSAASRVRSGEATRVALVVPPGSRVATSRMNFRLLARDASVHGRRLAIVAPDAASRALAAAAGLEVFSSVGEYEAAMAAERAAREAERAGASAAAAAAAAGTGAAGTETAAGTEAGAAAAGASATSPEAAGTEGTAADAAGTVSSPATGTDGADARRKAGKAGKAGKAAVAGAATAGAAAAGAAAAGAAAGAEPGGPTGPAVAGAPPAPSTAAAGPPAPGPAGATGSPLPASPAPPPGAPGPDALRPRSAGAAAPPAPAKRAGRRLPVGPVAILLGLLAVVALVAGVAGYLLLPSATIVVTPKVEPLGPVALTVTADPAAKTVDKTAGVIPAETLTFNDQASGTYPATGKTVTETNASGTVTFQNCNFLGAQAIAAGSVVATGSGVRFTTNEALLIPQATLDVITLKVTCATRDVGITAIKAGPSGNVAAGAIRVVPRNVDPRAIFVRNAQPTTGGTHTETPKVLQSDVDAALKDLGKQLQAQFAADLKDPANTPSGLTLFPETASQSAPVPTSDPKALVGQPVASFTLAATATGTATAVDEAPISALAADKLRASVTPGYSLVADSVKTTTGQGRVSGTTVVFPATARGQEVRQLDAAALEKQVLGLTEAEARQVLEPYGTVTIDLTPDWATTIPSFGFRVDLTIGETAPVEKPSSSPSSEPSSSPSTEPSVSPSP